MRTLSASWNEYLTFYEEFWFALPPNRTPDCQPTLVLLSNGRDYNLHLEFKKVSTREMPRVVYPRNNEACIVLFFDNLAVMDYR